jgi:hypothetical protein
MSGCHGAPGRKVAAEPDDFDFGSTGVSPVI